VFEAWDQIAEDQRGYSHVLAAREVEKCFIRANRTGFAGYVDFLLHTLRPWMEL
jgi:hypothetical protein